MDVHTHRCCSRPGGHAVQRTSRGTSLTSLLDGQNEAHTTSFHFQTQRVHKEWKLVYYGTVTLRQTGCYITDSQAVTAGQ